MVFPVVIYGMLKNWCFWTVVLEKTLERLLDSKEIKPINPIGNELWIFIGRTDAEAEAPILGPLDAKSWLTGKDWCWERLKAGGEGDDRGWDGWMVSPTQRTWVWINSGRWWRTGKPGILRSMRLQRVEHNWVNKNLYARPSTTHFTITTKIAEPLHRPGILHTILHSVIPMTPGGHYFNVQV